MNTFFRWECEELAAMLVGFDPNEDDVDMQVVEEKLFDEFGIDVDNFTKLIDKLANHTVPVETTFGNKYQGFVDTKYGTFVVKKEY